MKRSTELLWLAGALLAGAAQAQQASLPDPTRPPAVLTAPAPGAATPRSEADTLQLTSILVSQKPGGRRLAVINGKTLRQGERIGGMVVEAIRPTEVVLRGGTKARTMKLFRPAASVATVQP